MVHAYAKINVTMIKAKKCFASGCHKGGQNKPLPTTIPQPGQCWCNVQNVMASECPMDIYT